MNESTEHNQWERDIRLIVVSVKGDEAFINTQFRHLKGFETTIIKESRSLEQTGHVNFLTALKLAVTIGVENQEDFVCVCTEDCLLEKDFGSPQLIEHIRSAVSLGAKLLMGNVGSYDEAVYCGSSIFWINAFENTNFFVISKTFYNTILSLEMNSHTSIWNAISFATSNKFVIFPFISKYRDSKRVPGVSRPSEQIAGVSERFELIRKVTLKYKN